MLTVTTVRKYVDKHAVISVEMKRMTIDKSSLKVAAETDWKDVTARYKKYMTFGHKKNI
jgi:hypothetical protein